MRENHYFQANDKKEKKRRTNLKLQPIKKLCIEKYENFAELGRFAVRDMGTTVAAGVIKEISVKG